MDRSLFPYILFLILNIGALDLVELPVEFGLVVYNILNISVELLRNVVELVPSSIFQNVGYFDFISLGHDVSSRAVLGKHEGLDSKGNNDEEEKELGLVVGKHYSRIYHIGCIRENIPTLVMIDMNEMTSIMFSHQLIELVLVGRMRFL